MAEIGFVDIEVECKDMIFTYNDMDTIRSKYFIYDKVSCCDMTINKISAYKCIPHNKTVNMSIKRTNATFCEIKHVNNIRISMKWQGLFILNYYKYSNTGGKEQ